MMASYCRGTLLMILILLTLPHLKCNPVCPSGCYCNFKGAVNCTGPSITDIPKQLPTHTYWLQMLNTNMNVITGQSLANQDLLLRFCLTESHLHTIHPEAFRVAPQLRSVKLSSNDLSSLPARVFSPLTTLQQLLLDDNQLETITSEMFEGLFELLELDLNQNKIGSLASGVFDGMTKLIFLNLGRNSIKKIPPNIFHSLTRLNELIIYNNELEVLEPGIFDRLVKLETLKLHQNQMTSLPPRVFWSLGNLKILTLSSNKLKALPEKSFYNMPRLTKLTIYNNPLLSLPDELMGRMPDIKQFYLYATNLTTVPGNLFANMSGLVTLNFHLNDWLSELPSDLFCCLPSIKKLSLKFNNLVHLHPQLFSRLTTLELLILNDNKLQSLPENIFHGLGQLLLIDLRNNTLKTLQGDIFQSNTNLSSLTLRGNPWNCTCSIRGIAKWIRQNPHVVLDRDDVICHSPGHQMQRTISSLTDEDFDFCNALTVKNYLPRGDGLRERTTPSYTNPTSKQTSVAALTTTPPTTVLTTFKEATRHVTTTAASPTTEPTHLPTTMLSTSLQTPTNDLPDKELMLTADATWDFDNSPAFYHTLVLEEGPEFVHHNFYRGWVYVWFLPSDTALTGVLMFSHILLVTTGLVLILASIYYMCRLNKSVDVLRLRALKKQDECFF